jgi:hypothetical protein
MKPERDEPNARDEDDDDGDDCANTSRTTKEKMRRRDRLPKMGFTAADGLNADPVDFCSFISMNLLFHYLLYMNLPFWIYLVCIRGTYKARRRVMRIFNADPSGACA